MTRLNDLKIIIPFESHICITAHTHTHTTHQRQNVLVFSLIIFFFYLSRFHVRMDMAVLLAIKTVYCVNCQCERSRDGNKHIATKRSHRRMETHKTAHSNVEMPVISLIFHRISIFNSLSSNKKKCS